MRIISAKPSVTIARLLEPRNGRVTYEGTDISGMATHKLLPMGIAMSPEGRGVFCQLQTHVKERRDGKSGEMRQVTTDDEANLILRFADGDLTEDATGIVSVSMVEYPKYQNRIEFFGTEGAMRVEHRGEIFLAKKDDEDWREIEVDFDEPIAGIPDTGFSRGFTSFAPKIIEAICEGRTEIENAATFEDGCKVQKVLDAARCQNLQAEINWS